MSLKFSNITTKIFVLPLLSVLVISFAFLAVLGFRWGAALWDCNSASQTGDFAATVNYAQQSADTAQIFGEKHNPFLLFSLVKLGAVYEARRKFDAALAIYKKQLSIANISEGSESTAAAAALVNIGRIYKKQHQFVEAEPFLKHAVSIYETSCPQSGQALADALDFLAWTIGNQNHYDQAFALYQQELAVTEKLYGKDNMLNATPLVGLGWALEKKGSFKEALPFLDAAYELAQTGTARGSAWLTVALTTLANIYRDHKEYKKAESTYQLALSMSDTTLLMRNNLFKSDIMTNYAQLLRSNGQEKQARKMDMAAQKIRNGTF